ncbi:Omp28-related outer membrane protein [Myroides odoratus]|uniref:Omp28-related outer membrane protein n=1 Tax=Myroides odoratus TaxID=256 RepID=A0A9Q7EAD4_MYROD|nr:Omp28-related outer membrane protein [Myroides odoratus]EHQ42436.1 hypothetical protein Myrod_1603 [Myroides odoratus DSM 2801]EKB07984.1 hypothetical protein HMPREF9716_01457 [Myroides odoratus CIP 103059]QQT99808.1 Omp28-related outer membrane protein [Myroides odoratus]WQD57977.1 Omp28-related outer membrane protein [Myroides odoratus]STZ29697.1 Outer membrane protein Omp28 [Myroides odoratus]
MRKKILQSAILILTMAFMVGCSSDDSSSTGGGNPDGGNPDGGNPGGENPGGENPGGENPGETGTTYYMKKVILEDYTSIGCVACPIGSFIIEGINESEYKDHIIPVSVHDHFQSTQDPFKISAVDTYARHMRVQYLPSLYWNRVSTRWDYPEDLLAGRREGNDIIYFFDHNVFKDYINQSNHLKNNSTIGIKIASTLAQSSGEVSLNIKVGKDDNKNLKYLVYVLEDGLINKQANGTPLYGNTSGTPRWENNFNHDNVLRATNDILGTTITASDFSETNEFSKTVSLNYTAKNTANLKVVVAVLNDNGIVQNAQIAKANTTQDYQIVE